jgi:hypothetical protein
MGFSKVCHRIFVVVICWGLAACSSASGPPKMGDNPAFGPIAGSQISSDANSTAAYYRFESGTAGQVAARIVDSSPNHLNGSVLAGAPTYSAMVPVGTIPQTHRSNSLSIRFGAKDALKFAYAFPFETQPDATLEFWVNPTSAKEDDLFWTTLDGGNKNRFEIGIGADFGGAFIDYRDPSGVSHQLGLASVGTPSGEWSFLAFVKKGNVYSIYVNNSLTGGATTLESRVTDAAPNLPTSTGWSINGRATLEPKHCCQFAGLLDEVRLSSKALTPSKFLIAPSGPPAPDTIYVQTSNAKVIRQYLGASQDNGAITPSETLPTGDLTNGDVVYDPISDTLWYPEANQSNTNHIEVWAHASQANGNSPTLVTFPFGEGAGAFDQTHHLLFVASTTGPFVSVYSNAEAMTSTSTPGAVITLQINDGPSARPQEMLYDAGTDRLFVADGDTVVAVFDAFGAAAEAAIAGMTNPTIPANRHLRGLFSPNGLAYAPPPIDILFVGEDASKNDMVDVHNASSFDGTVDRTQAITGFSSPGGMAFDSIRDELFVYDRSPVYVIDNAVTASGTLFGLFSSGQVQMIVDSSPQQNIGFGIALDTTH